MRVMVRLFARLKDIAGTGELEPTVTPDATVTTVWEQLVDRYPDMAPYGASTSAAVNAEYAHMNTRLHDGDEVAFLPPVSGGTRQAHHD